MSYARSCGLVRSVTLAAAIAAVTACATDPEAAKKRYFDSGTRYVAEQNYQAAILEYRNAIQQDPLFGEARYQLAEAYAHERNMAGAFREYVRAADLLPRDINAQMKAGQALLVARRFEDARMRAETAIALNPRHVGALILRANALAGLKDVDAAVREIEEAIALDLGSSSTYAMLGSLQLTRGKRAEAESAFKRAVEADPRAIAPHLGLANYYMAMARTSDAEASLKHAAALDPRNALANRALATFYMAVRRPAEAEPYWRALAELLPDPAVRLALADYYLSMNRSRDAVKMLEELAGTPGMFAEARLRLASVQDANDQRADAHRTLDEVLDREPTHAAALTLKAQFLLADGTLDDALARARAATAADPRSATAHYVLGTVYAARNDVAEARKAFRTTFDLNPRVQAARLQLARLELLSGDPVAAVGLAQDAVNGAPRDVIGRLALAQTLLSAGELAKAEAEIRPLIDQHPTVALVHALMGTLHMMKRDPAAARQAYERALALDNNSLEALDGIVNVDLAARKPAAAAARVEARLARTPADSAVMLLAARVYATGGDTARAQEMLRKALQVNPNNLRAYTMLGQLYAAQNRLDDARAEFQELAGRHPRPVGALSMVGMLFQAQGRTAEAQKQYERVLQLDPEAAVAANNLAGIYAEGGHNLDVALSLAQTAKRKLPDAPEINDTLGDIYLRKGLASLAVPPLRESIEKSPRNPVYRYRLGVAYAKLGDRSNARQYLESALALQADFRGAAEARSLLASMRD